MSDIRLARLRLYALLTERHCRQPWAETARALLAGGVDAIQFREKDLADGQLLERARVLRALTKEAGALFIVNDRPDIAALSDADGVHLGQEDLPPAGAREILGPERLVGWSTHGVDQALAAPELPVDYIGVGPFAPTATKGYRTGKGVELIQAVRERVDLPIVAIGGITAGNAADAVAAGAAAVAVCSALCGADDPASAARQLRAAVERGLARREGDRG
jgi:thiamine-phosphate pyrophosphorylase